ncbi:hypothetical protein ISF_06314 [Cordyceps fumosorosea ARSEF 2679]|uniref:Uncharacterized protein n=1 Tax=Cordyceps fumosorosea (strain ARSEF 2679) TaxID=1081104 RepID=A0A167S900_CORFA|nr:hypothetical protein ISF_06314 [Cordyceps fumosorosea ARSEF 2679]OAA59379.1 hypothetical protein ISF_06314 [Cordyceps fumosorosea ARSEF 2679]
MAHFPPIDVATICAEPPNSTAADARYTRKVRDALKHLAKHDGTHGYAFCWGYTVFRTVYTPGSDERVVAALERLAVYASYFVTHDTQLHPRGPAGAETSLFDTRRLNEGLIGRYYSELIDDEQSLAGLGESEVGERFDAWVAEHRSRPMTAGKMREQNTRFEFCLMLDEESLDSILALPRNPYTPASRDGADDEEDEGECYVKVVSNRIKSEGEPGAVGRYWLRVGVFDFLWPMWFFPCDPDVLIEEMGVYDPEDGVQNLWGTPDDWIMGYMAAPS